MPIKPKLKVVLLISLIVIIVFLFFLFKQTTKKEITEEKLISPESEMQIKKCLETDTFDYECSRYFMTTPALTSIDFCNKLETNLKDKCFYNIANSVKNTELCKRIEDNELREKCSKDAIKMIMRFGVPANEEKIQ